MEKLFCSCGYGDGRNHILGEGECCRMEATGTLIPTNFRKFDLLNKGILMDVCDVNNYTITVYTLLSQRLYHNHGNGRWSLPKSKDSINSLDGEW